MAGIIPTTTPSQDIYIESDRSSHIDFQNVKAASDTMKKNPKLEFSQADLLKLLSYLEGELQARDVVIAALKSEHVKQFIYASRNKTHLNDPNAALFRDNLALTGNLVSRQSSTAAAQSELAMRMFARQQLDSLEKAIFNQRHTHMKLIGVMKDSEEKHKNLMNELEEEKQKHERDTAQGDDITYGLEVERTRLKQDLESEKQAYKKLEKDVKKLQEAVEAERGRMKPIVLLLLAERKRIIMKYIEERKRSEDLAQILSEEKLRVDTIAEGLEEESKKSLRMEAELEKQAQSFDVERKQLIASLANDEKKIKDQELEINQLKAENEMLRKQVRLPSGVPQLPAKGMNVRAVSDPLDDNSTASPMMSSVAKVVQPTATVSSVPVSGPTTGIARSISPGQSLRQTSTEINTFNTTKLFDEVDILHRNKTKENVGGRQSATVAPRKLSNASAIPTSGTNSSQTINSTVPKVATATISHPTIKKNPAIPAISRGVPPPIPPNKPIVPPTRLNMSNMKESTLITGTIVTANIDDGSLDGHDDLQEFQQVISNITGK